MAFVAGLWSIRFLVAVLKRGRSMNSHRTIGHRRAHDHLRAVARLAIDDIPAAALARRWGVPQCGVFRTLTSSLDAIHDLGAQGHHPERW